jgi:hypothetical protein
VPAGPRLVIAVSVVLLVVLVIVGVVTRAQMNKSHTQVIMNLLNGQQYFGVPHVFIGKPVYYGPKNASQYWSQGFINSNQPVLELTPARRWSISAMFWQEYYNRSLVKITIIGTYTKGSPLVGSGFGIYLFLKPTMWGVSPKYNYYSRVYVVYRYLMLQSLTPYIVVGWDPALRTWARGATGQWFVGLVTNPSGYNPSIDPYPSPNLGNSWAGWIGIGTGAFNPEPGDWINVTVTYNPSTNTLSGVAYDMNHTGWKASFTLYLDGYYKPPSSGTYVFGVVASAAFHYANWALLYVAMTISAPTSSVTTPTMSSTSTKPTPSAPSLSTILTWVVVVVLIIAAAILITVLRMIKRSER